MLSELLVRDFAIIDEVRLELHPGLTVLTGETGAGKSILVDALGLVLGERADASVIRHGAARAEIVATFELSEDAGEVARWLERESLDADGECIVRRVISREGRSRAFVNGTNVPLRTLRRLARGLANIHGQQANQSLVRAATQRRVLDHHGTPAALLERVAACHAAWQALERERQALLAKGPASEHQLALLEHQTRELEALALGDGELAALDEEHRRLAHQEQLMEGVGAALQCLASDSGSAAQDLLHSAIRSLSQCRRVDEHLGETEELLQNARIQTEEAAAALERYLAGLEAEPGRLAALDARLASIHELARKHRVRAEELPALAAQLAEELDTLTHAGQRLDALQARLDEAASAYRDAAAALHEGRTQGARALGKEIESSIRDLGMPEGRFEVAVTASEPLRFTEHGSDEVSFLVSTNAGQPTAPLARVASGGELARISLAIEVIAADVAGVPTMVFDEVDSGIGGGVAEIVGRRLRALASERQVLCVTHLPQVASQAHQHLRVHKHSDGEHTATRLSELDESGAIEELARMLGGVEITRRTRAHAREMRQRAQTS